MKRNEALKLGDRYARLEEITIEPEIFNILLGLTYRSDLAEVGMTVGSSLDLEILFRENFGAPIGVDQMMYMDHFFAGL
jgi:hypothetical protein